MRKMDISDDKFIPQSKNSKGILRSETVSYYICNVLNCNQSFKTKEKLNRHETTHMPNRLYKYDICNKKFKTKNILDHKKIHTLEKLFNCDKCNKSYRRKYNLQVHQRYHSGDGLYKCKFCPKKFSSATSRNIHSKRKHTLIKTHWCKICSKGYYISTDLIQHIKIHDKSNYYYCNICKQYLIKHYFNRHLKTQTHHNNLKFLFPSHPPVYKTKKYNWNFEEPIIDYPIISQTIDRSLRIINESVQIFIEYYNQQLEYSTVF